MINIEKQIDYWRKTSEDNIETVGILIDNKKYLEGLFFCHLSIEKILKALVVKETKQFPPKSHNLDYLRKLSAIEVSEEYRLFMAVLMKYQLEFSYPEYYPAVPSVGTVNEYFCKTKDLMKCLRQKL